MSYRITPESFDSLRSYWPDPSRELRWSFFFVSPAWLKVWWQVFGAGAELYLRAVREGEKIIGIAPLFFKDGKASIIGSGDVCDYLDFVVVPGREEDFFRVLLDDLAQRGVSLDLISLRPDSTVLTNLVGIARERNCSVICEEDGVSVEVDLPATFDDYLEALSKKQRHEVRRKLRRLLEENEISYHCDNATGETKAQMDTFLKLFALSRDEKAGFMTAQKELFFRSLVKAMAEIGLVRFGVLEVNKLPLAMTLGFDYNNSIYLYNCAYDSQYSSLSVGLLSKVLCIKESIEEGKKKFDLLRGNEDYKYHLGGKEIPLFRCRITIPAGREE